jgi:peptidase E
MPADHPTILATSGGYRYGERIRLEFNSLVLHAVDLSGVQGRRPRLTFLGTASGDAAQGNYWMTQAGQAAGIDVTCLDLFPMPSTDDIPGLLLDSDVVWVQGGSVANLLAVWAVHDLGPALQAAWQSGVVLAGVSAGSICWYVGGCTDSFGPELRAVTNGLAFLPYGNGVHYDSEASRRPTIHRLVAGVGLIYHGTDLVEAVSEADGKGAYAVELTDTGVTETRIEPRRLPAP